MSSVSRAEEFWCEGSSFLFLKQLHTEVLIVKVKYIHNSYAWNHTHVIYLYAVHHVYELGLPAIFHGPETWGMVALRVRPEFSTLSTLACCSANNEGKQRESYECLFGRICSLVFTVNVIMSSVSTKKWVWQRMMSSVKSVLFFHVNVIQSMLQFYLFTAGTWTSTQPQCQTLLWL